MSDAIREPRLWDLVTRAGGSSVVLSVPGTYSVAWPLNGVMVSRFLTPSLESRYTYPAALRDEIADVVGEYIFDTKDFDRRQGLPAAPGLRDDRPALPTRRASRDDEAVDAFRDGRNGPDRMHHGFWKFMDPEHEKHEPGSAYENAILDYHRHVDGLIGGLLEHADDETVVFVLSDHGAKRLDGGISINEWLRSEGLLATLAEPEGLSALRDVGIDWAKTTAWGGRLLRPRLPERAGPRAPGSDPAGAVRSGARRPRAPHSADSGRSRQPDSNGGLHA